MKTKDVKSVMLLVIVSNPSASTAANSFLSYIIGGIVALLILGYLVYTLLHPERF
jgi:K+-transporting ATPase KdpF subunit